jgi:hypothetical protein
MTKDNENTTPSKENETKLFAARLRTLADLVEQDKITSAMVYAFVDGVSPTAEFNAPIFPHVFAGQFCNYCEADFADFLDEMHTWATSVHTFGGLGDCREPPRGGRRQDVDV